MFLEKTDLPSHFKVFKGEDTEQLVPTFHIAKAVTVEKPEGVAVSVLRTTFDWPYRWCGFDMALPIGIAKLERFFKHDMALPSGIAKLECFFKHD